MHNVNISEHPPIGSYCVQTEDVHRKLLQYDKDSTQCISNSRYIEMFHLYTSIFRSKWISTFNALVI